MILFRLVERAATWTNTVAARVARPQIVFMGDSITEQWVSRDPWMFRPVRFGAGIGGQTSAQMLARFSTDVIARRPRVVHIMGGTNDLWFGDPGEGASNTIDNVAAMASAARAAGIAPILAPPPPIARRGRSQIARFDLFQALHEGIVRHASEQGFVLVDYGAVLLRDGELDASFTTDGIHLRRAGYRAMRKPAETAIALALSRAGERG